MAQVVTSILKDPGVESARVPPCSIEAEQHVLGGLLLWPDSYDRIDWLLVGHFYTAAHRAIFAAMEGLLQAGKHLDTFIVADALQAAGELEIAGGKSYLGSLAVNTPSAANIVRYAEIVRERWQLREVISRGIEITDAAFAHGADARTIAENAEAGFLSLLDDRSGADLVPFARAVHEAIEAREAPADVVIRTPFPRLNDRLNGGGLKPGNLIIVAARPAMGKTAFAFQIGEYATSHVTVAAFSLEMTRAELAERSLRHHEAEIGQSGAMNHLCQMTMFVDETPAVTVSHIRLRCRRLKRKHGLGLIVVDYLQLMSGTGENRTQEIGSISRGLKALAKELNVPVLAVAQINRGVEQRNDKRPMLSDLREAGDIEQDADLVLMLYRDEYYNPGTDARGLAEVLIRKQRNGPIGIVPLAFDGPTTRFHHYDGDIPNDRPGGGKPKNMDDYRG